MVKAYEYLKILYVTLRHSRFYFYPEKYKFEIGSHIFDELKKSPELMHNSFEKNTIFGIEIELNFHNPDCIKLYEDITNDMEKLKL